MKLLKVPTDSELSSFANQFALACREKNCFGICAVTSPVSELSHNGFCCDILNGQFLLKNLIQHLAQDFGLPVTTFAAMLALYLADLENGAVNEEMKTFNLKNHSLALNTLKSELDKIFKSNMKNLQWA